MQPVQRGRASVVVLTEDAEVLDHVLAGAAVAGIEPEVLADPTALRAMWSAASVVVLGADQAPAVARLALPRRTEVYLVGQDSSHAEACRWSVRLGAAVVMLPDGATLLESAMAEGARRRQAGGRLLAVIGGSGGVGTSTFAAAMCFAAVRAGRRSLLIDCDPYGGGIDLLVGAERIPGWRWPQFADARGSLGELRGELPVVDGVDVLAMGRPADADGVRTGVPGADQLTAVVTSAIRSHDLVVADLPRSLAAGPLAVLGRADLVLVVVLADVRGVAAARQLSAELAETSGARGILVRPPQVGRIDAETVSEALGLPVIGVLVEEPALRKRAERGDPPGRSQRGPLGRLCRAVLADQLAIEAAA